MNTYRIWDGLFVIQIFSFFTGIVLIITQEKFDFKSQVLHLQYKTVSQDYENSWKILSKLKRKYFFLIIYFSFS